MLSVKLKKKLDFGFLGFKRLYFNDIARINALS